MKKETFEKLTKAEKLKIPIADWKRIQEIEQLELHRVLFLPIKKKKDGYSMSAMFVELGVDGHWERVQDYDCFKFHIEDTGYSKYIQGDFEHGGVVFFLEKGGKYKYSGEFIKKRD